jgi:hypothetical protein
MCAGWAFIGLHGIRDAASALAFTGVREQRLVKQAMHGWLYLSLAIANTQQDDRFVRQSREVGIQALGLLGENHSIPITPHAYEVAIHVRDAVLMFAYAARQQLRSGNSGTDGTAAARSLSGISTHPRITCSIGGGDHKIFMHVSFGGFRAHVYMQDAVPLLLRRTYYGWPL